MDKYSDECNAPALCMNARIVLNNSNIEHTTNGLPLGSQRKQCLFNF